MKKQKAPQKKLHKSVKRHSQKLTSLVKRNRGLSAAVLVFTLVASSFTLAPLFISVSAAPTPAGYPTPTDAVVTPYGSIGEWMVTSKGQIANYGGQKYQGKTLLEANNIVIVDPSSKSVTESKSKVNKVMKSAGFPSRFGHSTGFKGYINDVKYSQLPSSLFSAYSDASFLTQNNHGRLFGPAAVSTGGYVYNGSFSTEKFASNGWLPAHVYVSSNIARDAVASKLAASGQTQSANIDMTNAYNTVDTTTGDHDGKAALIILK